MYMGEGKTGAEELGRIVEDNVGSDLVEPKLWYSLKYNKQLLMLIEGCLLYTSPSPRDGLLSRMPSSA